MKSIETTPLHISALRPCGPGKNYSPPKASFETPERISNAASTEPLSLAHEWRGASSRPSSMDFMQCKSRGLG